jgi:cellulose synthase/poly-beta-1,6-N-acetylglucosamine synthase-like glycosyltransferase
MMVKDEADVIEATIEHLFAQDIDALIVADNGSTDGTLELLNTLSQRLSIVLHSDPEVGYYQARKMTRLAQEAELKAHPPQPKDIILNNWRIEAAPQDEREGGAR